MPDVVMPDVVISRQQCGKLIGLVVRVYEKAPTDAAAQRLEWLVRELLSQVPECQW